MTRTHKHAAKRPISVAIVVYITTFQGLIVWPAVPLLSPVLGIGKARAEPRDTERDRWQRPNEVVAALKPKNGEVIADIGAGSGYFTMRLARAVGPEGKVYAVDIVPHVVEYLRGQAKKAGLNNVETILSRENDPSLPRGSVDLAFLCNTVHEIADRVNFYRQVARAIKRGGRMAVIEFAGASSQGKSPESGKQVSRDTTVREAEKAGFRLREELRFLSQQYFLIFEKAPPAGLKRP